ncbi:hypothetical protein [Nocardia anaemiae]|uniref:hypothetical protein n=1 Tax=Nocardia anaemiae TaxID=263910 RepID=UPI0012F50F48|nr:hypothetical protein [Nocardia anaemiae]
MRSPFVQRVTLTAGHPRPRPPLAETSRIAEERAVVEDFLQAVRSAGGPPGYELVVAGVNW